MNTTSGTTSWTTRQLAESLVRSAAPDPAAAERALTALDTAVGAKWSPVGGVDAALPTDELRQVVAKLPGLGSRSAAVNAVLDLTHGDDLHTQSAARKALDIMSGDRPALRQTLQARGLDTVVIAGNGSARMQRVPAAFLDASSAVDLLNTVQPSSQRGAQHLLHGVGARFHALPTGIRIGGAALGVAALGTVALAAIRSRGDEKTGTDGSASAPAPSVAGGGPAAVGGVANTPKVAASTPEEQQRAMIVQGALDTVGTRDMAPDGTLDETVAKWKAATIDGQPENAAAGWEIAFATHLATQAKTPIGKDGTGASTVLDLRAWAEKSGHFRAADDSKAAKAGNFVLLERTNAYGLTSHDVGVVVGQDDKGLHVIAGNRMVGDTAEVDGSPVYVGTVGYEVVPTGASLKDNGVKVEGFIDAVSKPVKVEKPKPKADPKAEENKVRASLVERAATQLEVREHNTNRGPEIDEYWQSATKGALEIPNSQRPWCAAFVSWVFNEEGKPFADRDGTVSAVRAKDWAQKNDIWHSKEGDYEPKPGDLIIFAKNSGGADHIGLVESYNADTGEVVTIEGNTSSKDADADGQGVYRKHHKESGNWVRGYINVMDYYAKHPEGPQGKGYI